LKIKLKHTIPLMKDLNLSRVQACGIWGNIGGETGGLKYLQELHPVVPGSKGGEGWKQWTGPRRRAYDLWCKQHNYDPTADEANIGYVIWEGQNTESHAINQLRRTSTLEAATETYMKLDLRPGAPHLEGRINWAKKAYEATANTVAKTDVPVIVAGGGAVVATASWWQDHWMVIAGLGAAAIISYIIVRYIQYRNKK
jgi:hypothetical protein